MADLLAVVCPFLEQIKRVWGEAEVYLRNRQAFAALHGRSVVEVATLAQTDPV